MPWRWERLPRTKSGRTSELRKRRRLQLLPSYKYGIHNNRGAKMAVFTSVIIASSLGKGRAGRGRVGKRSSAAWRAAHFPSYASRCNVYFILQSIISNLLQPSQHHENHPLSHNIAHWMSNPHRHSPMPNIEIEVYNTAHRVDWVLGFFSNRPKFGLSTPSPAGECVPPPLVQGRGHTHLREGVGGPSSNKGTDTVARYTVYVLCGTAILQNEFTNICYSTRATISGVPCFGSNIVLPEPKRNDEIPRETHKQ